MASQPDRHQRAHLPIPQQASNGTVLVYFAPGAAAVDEDHLLTPEERLRVAMARQ